MTPEIRRYLFRYIARRRAIALICAASWAIAFAIVWVILLIQAEIRFALPHSLRVLAPMTGVAVCIAMIARPIACLFRRYDPVAAAVEIESRNPEFDQRLITVASQPMESAMLNQLMTQVKAVVDGGTGRARVALRPLLAPVLALVGATMLGGWYLSTAKTRPSGPSLNGVLQIWNDPVNRSGK